MTDNLDVDPMALKNLIVLTAPNVKDHAHYVQNHKYFYLKKLLLRSGIESYLLVS